MHEIITFFPWFIKRRIAVYKAVYPTVGTLTDVLSAIDQVRRILSSNLFFNTILYIKTLYLEKKKGLIH